MKSLTVKAVIITDGTTYMIHGSSEETSEAMFKAMSPIWHFDPAKEIAHFIEVEVALPELETKNDAS